MTTEIAWFIAGLVMLFLLAQFAPRVAGGIAFLLVIGLALAAAKKGVV